MSNVVAINVAKHQVKRTPKVVRQARQQAIAGSAIGLVALTLMGLSLCHLARGIEIVTHVPEWESWAMAIGIDLGFIALEIAQITTISDKLRKAIMRYARPTIVGTMIASAVLNAFAFSALATGWMFGPAIVIGVAVPVLIYALTRVGTAMLTH